MITYELAKELKDNGFPQPEVPSEGNYSTWILHSTYGEAYSSGFDNDKEPVKIKIFPGMTYARELIYIPTLSELIKAVREEARPFGTTTLIIDQNGTAMATCNYRSEKEGYVKDCTPEEAMAKLFLAIVNK